MAKHLASPVPAAKSNFSFGTDLAIADPDAILPPADAMFPGCVSHRAAAGPLRASMSRLQQIPFHSAAATAHLRRRSQSRICFRIPLAGRNTQRLSVAYPFPVYPYSAQAAGLPKKVNDVSHQQKPCFHPLRRCRNQRNAVPAGGCDRRGGVHQWQHREPHQAAIRLCRRRASHGSPCDLVAGCRRS